jgi:hypothetical protein
MWLRKFLTVGIVALLISTTLSPTSSAASDLIQTFVQADNSWIPSEVEGIDPDTTRYTVNDSFVEPWLTGGGSNLTSMTKKPLAGNPDNFNQLYCASYQDKECRSSDLFFFAVLPVCEKSNGADCIVGLSVRNSGKEDDLAFKKYLDFQGTIDENLLGKKPWGAEYLAVHPVLDFVGEPSRDLPPGSRVSLWQSKTARENSNEFYAVAITMKGSAKVGKESDLENFQISITPVIEKPDSNDFAPVLVSTREEDGHIGVGGSWAAAWGQECIYRTSGKCYLRAEFPENIAMKLQANLSSSVTGWLHGRIGKPDIQVKNLSKRINQITISGEPLKIPIEVEDFKSSSLPKGTSPYGDQGGSRWNLFADGDFRFTWFEKILPFLDDKADAVTSAWSLRSVVPSNLNPCLKSTTKLMGLVTTNAMMYNGEAPDFEKGFLAYRVAGLHKGPNNEIWRGTYDLVMRSESARCLYKFSKAPVYASIQVVNSSGGNQFSTTVLNEKSGWLRLGAYNFTFSSPTIKVKLTQTAKKPSKKG